MTPTAAPRRRGRAKVAKAAVPIDPWREAEAHGGRRCWGAWFYDPARRVLTARVTPAATVSLALDAIPTGAEAWSEIEAVGGAEWASPRLVADLVLALTALLGLDGFGHA